MTARVAVKCEMGYHALNPAMTVFGAVMVAAGIAFGIATYHARVLPGWTGSTLASGVVLVVITLGLPAAVQLTAAGVRDLAFIGMGIAALGSGAGEMWNSNSLVAWLLEGSGHDMAAITAPARGRAPGWAAGLELAHREHDGADRHVPMARTS